MTKIHVNPDGRAILVTGSPGFIGASLVLRLLGSMKAGTIISLDDMGGDPALKQDRLALIEQAAAASPVAHVLVRGSVADGTLVDDVFDRYRPGVVVHLAACDANDPPQACAESNLRGFFNVLDACRRHPVAHFVYASSDAVYAGSKSAPSATGDRTDMPLSLFAATKKSNEMMAYSYARQHGLPCTGLRFFSVYGPGERPDAFCRASAEKLLRGEAVAIPNGGNCLRDFIYIDDAVEALFQVMQGAPPAVPYALYNIASGRPENLMDFVAALQQALVREGLLPADHDYNAHRQPMPPQPGDIPATFADIAPLKADYGFRPVTGMREGLQRFAAWYREKGSGYRV